MPNAKSPSSRAWHWRSAARACVAAMLIALVPVAGFAQETTSAIRGKVLDATGAPVSGAVVVVQDTRSGVQRSYTTDDQGRFLATRLLPGGPYRVSVDGSEPSEVASIGIGETYSLTVSIQPQEMIEEIVTVGTKIDVVDVASGPAATFNVQDIQSAVSFSRDISEVYGIDPRIMIDNEDDGFGVNCAGKHPRFNNVTLDGISQTDRFGLNDNGYSTAVGMPFPYDSIEQIAVELAPFDVSYGGFSACNINAVTKSGTNEWEVGAFYEFSNEDLRGDTIGDTKIGGTPSYDKTYYGFDIGGPIIKDRLFIFAAYEESDEPRFLARGYAGSGIGEERPWLSEADYNRIVAIATDPNRYGYDPGGQPSDGTQEAEKYMVRLDWNINENHNAAVIYNYFDGFQDRDSDGDDNEFEFANHFYVKGAESETYTFKLWSQWTDNFSTEVFWSTSEMNDSQVTVGPKEFGDFQIDIGEFPFQDTVYLGADDSRQANQLGTESTYFRLAGNYFIGNHIITAGYDREDLEIFNVFVQHSNGGEYDFFDDSADNPAFCDALTAQQRFDDPACSLSGIDRFELGRPSRIYYGSGGGTNNPLDAAAKFSNVLNALYVQDEIFFDNIGLTVTAGLRYEWFSSDDRPRFNQTFTDAVGIRNDDNIDGLDLIMPRIGFQWDARDDLSLRGGIGLYSGGNPNVWISNAWSNDGLTNAQFRLNNFGGAVTVFPGFADSVPLSGDGRPGFDVPQSLVDDVAAVTEADANDSRLVLIDPGYEQPSEWKLALGGTWDSPWYGIQVDLDYLHTRGYDPAYYRDVSQTRVGTTRNGIPIYDYTFGEDNFMLTNSDENPTSNTVSAIFRKSFDDWGLDVLVGWAYSEAQDVSPMTSAVAASNFDNTALLDIDDPTAGNSNYVVPIRYTLRLDWERAFFGDNFTQVTLYGFVNKGQPQSYAMSSEFFEGAGDFGRHLLYVPTGPADPNVVFGPNFDQQAFFAWVAREGLSPGFTERNGYNAGWSTRFDLRISQDIPLPGDLRGQAYLKIYNLGNLLNDDWGEIVDAQFFTPSVVGLGYEDAAGNDVSGVDALGRLVFGSFRDRPLETTYTDRSLWEARIGFDIKFGQ